MTDKFYLKEVCGEYKFFEKGDSFPLTEKQILNKLNENEQLKTKLEQYERIMSDFDVSSFDELRTIMEQGCGV